MFSHKFSHNDNNFNGINKNATPPAPPVPALVPPLPPINQIAAPQPIASPNANQMGLPPTQPPILSSLSPPLPPTAAATAVADATNPWASDPVEEIPDSPHRVESLKMPKNNMRTPDKP